MVEERYVIDTSSLIDLNRYNPIDLFPSVWNKIDHLVKTEQLVSHIEVFKELSRKDDLLFKWAKTYKDLFKHYTKRQVEIVQKILEKYPSIINPNSQYSADPWIIALAVELNEERTQKTLIKVKWLVVTEEQLKGNRVRIPLICKEYNIDYLKIFDLFRRKGWKF